MSDRGSWVWIIEQELQACDHRAQDGWSCLAAVRLGLLCDCPARGPGDPRAHRHLGFSPYKLSSGANPLRSGGRGMGEGLT